MNISSYNITDVGYHYIGLRVIAATSSEDKDAQAEIVARNVAKYAIERALRLMLPEPRGNFSGVGIKVLQELAHLELAQSVRTRGYELSPAGEVALGYLNSRDFVKLRRQVIKAHLETYDNLREMFGYHASGNEVLLPIVESGRSKDPSYLLALLSDAVGAAAESVWDTIAPETILDSAPKQIEDHLRARIIAQLFPGTKLTVPLFRAMSDRLGSLRLLNVMRADVSGREYARSYSPCVAESGRPWHQAITIDPPFEPARTYLLSEPDPNARSVRDAVLSAIDQALRILPSAAGYHDIPDVRDMACHALLMPEASFDDTLNVLLDQHPSPFTVGLQYERISGRRKPLVRTRESTQIYNLIRRA